MNQLTNKELATKLSAEAARNKTFNDVSHILAMRERSRNRITLNSLKATVIREGFAYTKEQCKEVLKFLASVGIGKLELNRTGNVRALVNIKLPLQWIGQAALGKAVLEAKSSSDSTKTAARIIRRRPVTPEAPKVYAQVRKPERLPASITVNVEGKLVSYELPEGISTKDLLTMLGQGAKATP